MAIISSKRPAPALAIPLRLLSAGALVATLFWLITGGPENAALAAAAGALALQGFAIAMTAHEWTAHDWTGLHNMTGPHKTSRATLVTLPLDAAAFGVFGLACAPALKLWAAPESPLDLLRLTPAGVLIAAGLYLAAALLGLMRRGRRPGLPVRLALLALPFLFNLLLGLGSPLAERAAEAFAPIPLAISRASLGGLVVFIVNEAIVTAACLVMGRRGSRDFRLHALLLAAGFAAAITPEIADFGTAAFAVQLFAPAKILFAALTAAGAQAGLWAEVFLVTTVLGDILHKAPPVAPRLFSSWRSGAQKGAVYGGVFMALLLTVAAFVDTPGAVKLLHASATFGAALLGAALFPLARAILESTETTPPFRLRLRAAYRSGANYAAGAVAGAGLLHAFTQALPAAAGPERFGVGFTAGALAYVAALLYRDVADIGLGLRIRPRTWRPYALGVLLGGAVGGALGWYFDQAQIDVIVAHFRDHVAVNTPGTPYVVTPFFNKWGQTDMGLVTGGVKRLYLDSLSGVMQWMLAAPLFSVNLFFLTALLQRDTAPIKKLFSAEGLTALVDNSIVVLRWGLWVTPIICVFLKVAPGPQWCNQDGLIRSGVAAWMSVALPPSQFRDWSLSLFTALLTYDWLRVLIWFDHVGLRVATLVNLSFVGGDMADAGAARFLGARARSRAIPDGIRRFATWAPLLLPFYMPRGAEWDKAWSAAELAAKSHTPALVSLLLGYGLAALGVIATLALFLLVRPRASAQPATLTNGLLSLGLSPDGQNFIRVETAARRGTPIDMTRAPDDSAIPRGGFIYFQEEARFWSLTPAPTGLGFGPLEAASPTLAHVRGEKFDLRCEATIELIEGEAIALTRLKLTNASLRPRRLRLATYRDWVMNAGSVERRDPAYNALHVGTCFVRDFAAIFARNRLLKNQKSDSASKRLSREAAFHAARPQPGVHLIGYEDVRARFFGLGQRRDPDALKQNLNMRDPTDEGLLYGFDPCAALLLEVEIPADGVVELLFADGWASDERAAASALARMFAAPIPENLDALFARRRVLAPAITPKAERFAFSEDGRQLQTTPGAPRPFSHVLANAVGFGAVVTHDGEIFTFHRDARANSVTPFRIGEGRNAPPAQAIYVVERETGGTHTATLLPTRRADTNYDASFALGVVTFTATNPRLDLRQELFVAPDDAAQIQLLTLTNRTDRPQFYRVAPVAEILLTETPADSVGALEAQADDNGSALYFRNAENEFVRDWVFAATSLVAEDCQFSCEVSRAKILGRKPSDPRTPFLAEHGHADGGAEDDGRRAAGFACQLEVAPGASTRIAFVLGAAPTLEEAQARAHRAATLGYADEKRGLIDTFWASLLSRLRIKTNQPAFDRLVNDWLPYQTLAARLWGRAGPEQRSGAFGYRDQLQDVLPMVALAPEIARRQILLHARQQFVEGDVLKWWRRAPDGGVGMGERSHAADPHLWLPYVTVRYVEATGDTAILHEQIGFVEGAPLPPGVEGQVIAPLPSREKASLIEHCRRALDFTLARFGAHGLPLIGAGDWNDGMNLVGVRGKGESVWMGFFLYDNLVRFAALLRREKLDRLADAYESRASALRFALDACWRGDRYVRAFADDGQEFLPIGAMCSAWPALSGAAPSERGRKALEHALAELDKGDRVLLVTPPYDETSKPFPGRSGDYPPGVRENGGQYTHGCSWLVDALMRLGARAAEQGDGEQADHDYARAVEVWRALSPLTKTSPDKIDIYGLPPHQQPADVYDGPGCEGRGGWSWSTGAAARMITAAHALLGLSVDNGELHLRADAFTDKAGLKLDSVSYKGKTFSAPAEASAPRETALTP